MKKYGHVFPVIIPQQRRMSMNTLGELWEDYEDNSDFTRHTWAFFSRLRNCCERKQLHFSPTWVVSIFDTKPQKFCHIALFQWEKRVSKQWKILFFFFYVWSTLSSTVSFWYNYSSSRSSTCFLSFFGGVSFFFLQYRKGSVLKKSNFPTSWKICCYYI